MLIKPPPARHSVEAQAAKTGLYQELRGSSNTGTKVFFVLGGKHILKTRLTGFCTWKRNSELSPQKGTVNSRYLGAKFTNWNSLQ